MISASIVINMNNYGLNRPEMQTPEYKQWRYSVMARDKFECQICHRKTQLEVHHVLKWANFPHLRYVQSNGISLCETCHDTVTGREEEYVQQFQQIIALKKIEFKQRKESKQIKSGKFKYRPEDPLRRY